MVIVDFAYEVRGEYEKLKKHCALNYNYLIRGDRKGATELDFGAWKLRMADELQEQISKRLEEINHAKSGKIPVCGKGMLF